MGKDIEDQSKPAAAQENPKTTSEQPKAEPDREAMPVDVEQPPRLPFPVVGVGASAGGLEAFSEFISAMRPDSGMAFVLILHLPPDRPSLLAEVLAHRTSMPVRQVEDGLTVEPDHVYVIRPGHVLTIENGVFHLGPELGGPRAANRPVDDFFKSLAQEQRERAICIVMSGMGSNGAAGAQAVKAVGGLCVAQDPESCQFPSMPRHLIDQGYADYILRPADMPDMLLGYAGHPYAKGGREADAEAVLRREQQHVREILAILRTRTRQDFNGYKKPTVLRRIQRRMGLARLTRMGEHAKLLRQTPNEVTALADDLLIHVTGFFRDPAAWEALRQRVIVPLIAAREGESEVRAWVTACSSGEEAYTLAMLLTEEAERTGKRLDIKVFATDMADRTLAHARAGVFPGGIEAEIAPERLSRFFERDDSIYRVRQELRERVVFAPQNLLQDPPFSRLDIATCRNLLIYLEPELQQRVLGLLHFGLREGGALFLGTSETVGGSDELFEPIDKQARIFRRIGPTRHGQVDFPLPHAIRTARTARDEERGNGNAAVEERNRGKPRLSVSQRMQRTLLEQHTPAAVTVDRDRRIVQYHGDTHPFFQQPAGEPSRDLMVLARDGVRGAVRTALHRAAAENAKATVLDGWLETGPDTRARIVVTASPLSGGVEKEGGAADYFVVSFEQREDVSTSTSSSTVASGGAEVIDELRRVRDELQSTIEELQTSNEELKASHEEVMSTNEELQSSNEELETSREEMQSLNEELSTVNSQLRAKMEEHEAARNDLSSLLTSTDIAVVFLDPNFRIRRFTPPLRDLLEVITSDVGRPLADLARKFTDPDLDADMRAVLDRLVPVEREIAANGRFYLRRALPYRTANNHIDGVVVTFVDITARKQAEQNLADELGIMTRLHDLAERLQSIADLPTALGEVLDAAIALFGADRGTIQIHDPDAGVLRYAASRGFDTKMLATVPPIDRDFHSTCAVAIRTGKRVVAGDIPGDPRWADHASIAAALGYAAAISAPMKTRLDELQGVVTVHFSQPHTPSDRDLRWLDLYARLGAHLVERGRAETSMRESEARYRTLFESIDEGFYFADAIFDAAGKCVDIRYFDENPAAQRMTGQSFKGKLLSEMGAYEPYWREMFGQVARTGEPMKREEFAAPDGIWYEFYAFKPPQAKENQFAVIFQDVTARRHAIDALRASEKLRQMAVESGGMGAWMWDAKNDRISGDAVFMELYGFPPSDDSFPLARFTARMSPEAVAACKAVATRELIPGEEFDGTLELAAGPTAGRWVRWRGRVDRDAPGLIHGVSFDVTERRRAEEALRESEERFRLVVDGARDVAMLLLDNGGKITTWNTGAGRLLGFSEAEAVGQPIAIIFTPDARAAGVPEEELKQAAATGHADDSGWRVRKDGSRFWASGVLTALRNQDGSIRGFVKVLRDESARKQLEDAEKAALEAAELANRTKDEFLATLSHELRTPLSAILLWAKMLSSKSEPKALDDGLAAIRNSADSQKQLIEDLLDTSRITSGNLRLDIKPSDLADVAKGAMDSVLPSAEAKGINIVQDVDAALGTVRIDPSRMKQVLWNLLSNAIKFTPTGGTVTLTLRRVKQDVELRVSDSGKGITSDFLPHVFEAFRQADSTTTRNHAGLGLGLAICKKLVEQHGGTITAMSDGLDRGATFIVTLPLPAIRATGPSKKHRSLVAEEPLSLAGIHVLLVEDDSETRNALAAAIRLTGATVSPVESAAAALETFKDSKIDLVVSDIGMPGEDGYSLLRRLRSMEAEKGSRRTPSLALTAFVSEEGQRKAAAAGFDRHLGKPVEPDQLLSVLVAMVPKQ